MLLYILNFDVFNMEIKGYVDLTIFLTQKAKREQAQGAEVAAADLNIEEVSQLAKEIGSAARPYEVDVSDVGQLTGLVDDVVAVLHGDRPRYPA